MKTVKATKATLTELKTLLKEYPMDREQRASVLQNAAEMSEKEVKAMTSRMKATVDNLTSMVKELNEKMFPGGATQTLRKVTAAVAYKHSVPEYA